MRACKCVRVHARRRRTVDAAEVPFPFVEVFRKADWTDASLGLRAFGLPRARRGPVYAAFPNSGFHARLVCLTCARIARHPCSNPLPMMRW